MTVSNRDLALAFWAIVAALIGAAYTIAKFVRMIYGGNP